MPHTKYMSKNPDIKCPQCGNSDLKKIEFVEDVPSTRTLEGFRDDGTFLISPESYEDMEFAENSRLSCKKCGKGFPTPEGLTIDYGYKLMTLRVTSTDTDPWEGSVDEFLENQDEFSKFLLRRIQTLQVGEHIAPELGAKFRIERSA